LARAHKSDFRLLLKYSNHCGKDVIAVTNCLVGGYIRKTGTWIKANRGGSPGDTFGVGSLRLVEIGECDEPSRMSNLPDIASSSPVFAIASFSCGKERCDSQFKASLSGLATRVHGDRCKRLVKRPAARLPMNSRNTRFKNRTVSVLGHSPGIEAVTELRAADWY
jgi:hypothetical protein